MWYGILIILLIFLTVLACMLYVRLNEYKRQVLRSGIQDVVNTIDNDGIAEEEIKKRAEYLAFRVDLVTLSGKMGMWDYDIKSNCFFYFNTKDSYFRGFTWEEYLEMVHPDDRNIPAQAMQKLIKKEADALQEQYRFRIPNSDGYKWFDLFAVASKFDEKGMPTVITGLRWDITNDIEEKQKLQESKTLLEFTFNAGGVIPWSFNSIDLKMSSDNKYSIFYQNEITIYEYIDNYVHPDYRSQFVERVDAMIKGERHFLDIKALTAYNGKYEWNHITGRIIADSKTKGTKAVGISRYITSEVEREEELIVLREKAEEMSRLKSAFLANMSHEIRTPLNAIVGFSNLITQTADPQEAKEYARIIEANNDLLLQLVSDILDISKIEAGQMEFNYEDCDVCAIYNELYQIYSYKMPENVELKCELADESYIINTDKNRFKQVMCNFLNNAVKYTSQGAITIGYSHQEDKLRFYVGDTGKGMAEENLPKVFERFAKFDSLVQGTGLGLSICETIVNRLDGKIGVESELGKGSEFWFTIPDRKK